MQLTINIEKRHVFIIFASILLLAIVLGVSAYTNPSTGVGHDLSELGCGGSSCDSNSNNIIDNADHATNADNVPWSGLTGDPVKGMLMGYCYVTEDKKSCSSPKEPAYCYRPNKYADYECKCRDGYDAVEIGTEVTETQYWPHVHGYY